MESILFLKNESHLKLNAPTKLKSNFAHNPWYCIQLFLRGHAFNALIYSRVWIFRSLIKFSIRSNFSEPFFLSWPFPFKLNNSATAHQFMRQFHWLPIIFFLFNVRVSKTKYGPIYFRVRLIGSSRMPFWLKNFSYSFYKWLIPPKIYYTIPFI